VAECAGTAVDVHPTVHLQWSTNAPTAMSDDTAATGLAGGDSVTRRAAGYGSEG